MKPKKHISTLTYTAMGVTALILLGSILLLGVSVVSVLRGFRFITAGFCLFMLFAVVIAVRMTIVQLHIGIFFFDDHMEFRLDETPIVLNYREIESIKLLNDGEPPKPKQKILPGGQLVFQLCGGGLRVVPLPKLRKAKGQRIVRAIKTQQKECME